MICWNSRHDSASLNRPLLLTYENSSPPPAYSMTSMIDFGVSSTSNSLMMCWCFSVVRMNVSRYTRSTSSTFATPLLSTILIATFSLVLAWWASLTLPNEPCPSVSPNIQSPMRFSLSVGAAAVAGAASAAAAVAAADVGDGWGVDSRSSFAFFRAVGTNDAIETERRGRGAQRVGHPIAVASRLVSSGVRQSRRRGVVPLGAHRRARGAIDFARGAL